MTEPAAVARDVGTEAAVAAADAIGSEEPEAAGERDAPGVGPLEGVEMSRGWAAGVVVRRKATTAAADPNTAARSAPTSRGFMDFGLGRLIGAATDSSTPEGVTCATSAGVSAAAESPLCAACAAAKSPLAAPISIVRDERENPAGTPEAEDAAGDAGAGNSIALMDPVVC